MYAQAIGDEDVTLEVETRGRVVRAKRIVQFDLELIPVAYSDGLVDNAAGLIARRSAPLASRTRG